MTRFTSALTVAALALTLTACAPAGPPVNADDVAERFHACVRTTLGTWVQLDGLDLTADNLQLYTDVAEAECSKAAER